MPRPLALHPSERVDVSDLEAVSQYAGGMVAEFGKLVVVDRQCRVLRGFRVELADQDLYPGRITVHGGAVLRPDGQTIFNEDDAGVSRTITLEGASTTFFVEVEYLEADATIDGRAFWDPTVPQANEPSGDPSPSGQEFTVNVPSRKLRDWRIVQPVRTGSQGFERDQFASTSNKIPILKITTDANNKIVVGSNPGLTTEKAATILLQQVTATQIIVHDPLCLPAAGASLVVGEGEANVETVSIISIDRFLGTVTVTSLANTHDPGQIVRGGTSTTNYLTDTEYGIYRRRQPGVTTYDFRDRMWQGDEAHGSILKRGFGTVRSTTDRNVQGLKDYVDFLAGQIQEMKWGVADPHMGLQNDLRIPPEMVGVSLPTTPRYYDRTGGLAPGRVPTIVVGDGVTSFGDFNGQDETVFQKAHDSLLGGAGVILVKPGSYTFNNDVTITANVSVRAWCGRSSAPDRVAIVIRGGCFVVASTGNWEGGFENLAFSPHASATTFHAIELSVAATFKARLIMKNCIFTDTLLLNTGLMDGQSSVMDCQWLSTGVGKLNGLSQVSCGDASTSILSGVWERCKFSAADPDDGSNCIGDGVTGKARMSAITFYNCVFTATGTNVSSAVWLKAVGDVFFDTCSLTGFKTNTFWKACIRSTDSIDLVVNGCFMTDRAVACDANIGVTISGCRSVLTGTTTNNGPIVLQDCSHVLVEGNLFEGVSATGQMLAGAIEFRGTNSWVGEDIVFCNNTILGVNNNSTGILITTTGIGNISSFNIYSNHIKNCEVGIAFNGDAAYVLNDCQVGTNQIVDFGVSLFEGSRMLCGILVDSNILCGNWTINGNMIACANVKSATLLNGVAVRAGIFVQSDAIEVVDFVISGNSIRNIGVAGNDPLGTGLTAWGIRVNRLLNVVISNNVINAIAAYDQQAVGIGAGVAVTTTKNCQINNNMIVGISTATSNPYGIMMGSGLASTGTTEHFSCVGNTVRGTKGLLHRCIAIQSQTITSCTINSNNVGIENTIGAGNDGSGIWVVANGYVVNLAVNGNTVEGIGSFNSMYAGIALTCAAFHKGLSVVGNTVRNVSDYSATVITPAISVNGVPHDPVAGDYENATIAGNMVYAVSGPGIFVWGINGSVVSGNAVYVRDTFLGTETYTGCIWLKNSKYFTVTGNTVGYPGAITMPGIGIGPSCARGAVLGNTQIGAVTTDGISVRTDVADNTEGGILVAGNVGSGHSLMGSNHYTSATLPVVKYPDDVPPP